MRVPTWTATSKSSRNAASPRHPVLEFGRVQQTGDDDRHGANDDELQSARGGIGRQLRRARQRTDDREEIAPEVGDERDESADVDGDVEEFEKRRVAGPPGQRAEEDEMRGTRDRQE